MVGRTDGQRRRQSSGRASPLVCVPCFLPSFVGLVLYLPYRVVAAVPPFLTTTIHIQTPTHPHPKHQTHTGDRRAAEAAGGQHRGGRRLPGMFCVYCIYVASTPSIHQSPCRPFLACVRCMRCSPHMHAPLPPPHTHTQPHQTNTPNARSISRSSWRTTRSSRRSGKSTPRGR